MVKTWRTRRLFVPTSHQRKMGRKVSSLGTVPPLVFWIREILYCSLSTEENYKAAVIKLSFESKLLLLGTFVSDFFLSLGLLAKIAFISQLVSYAYDFHVNNRATD